MALPAPAPPRIFATIALLLIVLAGAAAYRWLIAYTTVTVLMVARVDLDRVIFDGRPVTVRVRAGAGAEGRAWHTTSFDVRHNLTLWRRMHLPSGTSFHLTSAEQPSTTCSAAIGAS